MKQIIVLHKTLHCYETDYCVPNRRIEPVVGSWVLGTAASLQKRRGTCGELHTGISEALSGGGGVLLYSEETHLLYDLHSQTNPFDRTLPKSSNLLK